MRAVKKYRGRDADLEESMTEAETVSRQKPLTKDKSVQGYYHFVKKTQDKNTGDIIVEDRITVNKPKDKDNFRNKGKKGKSCQKAVQKNYPEMNISHMKMKGDAEAIDSYYHLENRKGYEEHVQTYQPSGGSDKTEDASMKKAAPVVKKWDDGKEKRLK
jgi:hypothetical protein